MGPLNQGNVVLSWSYQVFTSLSLSFSLSLSLCEGRSVSEDASGLPTAATYK